MDFSYGFEQHAYAGMDFLMPAPGKGVIEPVSQMEDFVLPALPDLLQEPGSSNLSSSSEGLDCLTADVSPTEDQSKPQLTEEAVEAKHCHNCGATETPRWRPAPGHPGESLCNACGLHLRTHGTQRDVTKAQAPRKGASGSGLKVNLSISVQLQHAAELISKIDQFTVERCQGHISNCSAFHVTQQHGRDATSQTSD